VTDVRLALSNSPVIETLGDYGHPYPALLASYAYYNGFKRQQDELHYRDWMLDSGAYTAFTCGKEIALQEYIDFCKKLSDEDPKLVEIIALDVIGDWKSSMKNYKEMRRQGVDAIPTYHLGSPTHVLETLCETYPKVAISGYALIKGEPAKKRYTDAVFRTAWKNGPKKLHALGLGTRNHIKAYPWHSIDTSSWMVGPMKYGLFPGCGNKRLGLEGVHKMNLRREVEYWLKIERHNKKVWSKELRSME